MYKLNSNFFITKNPSPQMEGFFVASCLTKPIDTVGELQAFRFQEVKRRESGDTLAQDSAVSAALSMPLDSQEDFPHMALARLCTILRGDRDTGSPHCKIGVARPLSNSGVPDHVPLRTYDERIV
jgi:hypothetical protein